MFSSAEPGEIKCAAARDRRRADFEPSERRKALKDKKILRIASFILSCLFLFTLVSCDGSSGEKTTESQSEADTTPTGPLTYTVTVTDYKGDTLGKDVLIEVKKGDEIVGMKKADAEGKVSFKLERGDYTFVPSVALTECYYDESKCTLTPDNTDATVVLYSKSESKHTIYPTFGNSDDRAAYDAAIIGEGATYVEIDRDDIAYYIFTPSRGGIYQISCLSDGEVGLGFYGDANAVRSDDIAKLDENGAFRFEVKNGSIGGELGGTLSVVIGLRSAEIDDAVIVVERVADPEKEVEWNNISASELPEDFERTDMLNHKLVNISVTDPEVRLVYSEADGYYHIGSESGAVVYMRISSGTKFLNSFTEICETAAMCRIYYDESGKVTRKDGYNQLIADYAEICDGNGVCPLTKELVSMIQNVGEHMGWWDFTASGNEIFGYDYETGEGTGINESNIVKGNEWLFACCYVEEFTSGSADKPITLTASDSLTYYAELRAGEPLYFTAGAKAELSIESAEGITLTCKENTYTADAEGKIVFVTDENSTIEIISESERIISFKYALAAE